MAHYPADTFQEATEIAIEASNQLHGVINGDANAEVTVEDGSKIPSVRKAMVDSLYFKPPVAWVEGEYEDTYNQLRAFVEPTGVTTWWFSKTATVSTPVLMSTTPHEDVNWTLWNAINNSVYETQKRLAAEAGLNMTGSFLLGGTVTTTDDVVFYETDGKYYGWAGALPKTVAAGSTPATAGGVGAGLWEDKVGITLRDDLNIVVKVFASVVDMVVDTSLVVGQKCRTLGYYAVGDGGANDYEIVAATTGTDDGGSYIDLSGSGYQAKGLFKDNVISPERFGAKYDGVYDDKQAIVSAVDYSVVLGINNVTGFNVFYIGSQIDLSTSGGLDLPRQFKMHLAGLKPLASFPDYEDMVTIGKTSVAEVREFDLFFGTVDGDNKRVGFINNAGLTRGLIRFITASNLYSLYNCNNNEYASASTKIVGQLVNNCVYGIYAKGASGKIAEGTLVDVQFIANCDKAGIFLGETARYCDIKGQSDYCGKHFIKLTMASLTGYSVGDVLTQGLNSGTIVAIFENSDNVSEIILDEESAIALFTLGSVTDGVTPEKVSSVHKSGNGNIYYDVIDNAWDNTNRFSRHTILMSYCGGFHSDYLAKASCLVHAPNVYSSIFNSTGPYSQYIDVGPKVSILKNNLTNGQLLRTSASTNLTTVNYDKRGDFQFNGNVITYDPLTTEGGQWDEPHFILGPSNSGFHLWRDSDGNLRMKQGFPASSSDGNQVGPWRKLLNKTIQVTQTAVPHGLPYGPVFVTITPLGNATVWKSASSDGTNVYLKASSVTNVDIYVM